MKPLLIYCYDAYCGWCYGFSSVLTQFWSSFQEKFDFEVLSAGMILPAQPAHISLIASHMRDTCKAVTSLSGVEFGADYMWHINEPAQSDWYPDSRKPSIALCILKDYFPDRQVQLAADIQHLLFAEGRDLCDNEAYRELLQQYQVPPGEFFDRLNSETYSEKANEEFSVVKQLKVTGYPALLLNMVEGKYYQVCTGYTDYESLVARLQAFIDKTVPSH
jgi:putative protein-disulfide isomerase